MTDTFKMALVEILRVAMLSVVPVIILSLENNELDWKTILVAFVIALLRGLDKFIHLEGVKKEEETGEVSALTKGITRF